MNFTYFYKYNHNYKKSILLNIIFPNISNNS